MNGVSTDALVISGGGQEGCGKDGLSVTGKVPTFRALKLIGIKKLPGALGRRGGALESGGLEWHVTMRLLRSKDLCFSSLAYCSQVFCSSLWLSVKGGVCQTRAIFGNVVIFIVARDLLASHRGHLSHSDWGLVGRCWGVC